MVETAEATQELTGSEAIYGFCAWLTCQDEVTIMSAHHNAGAICDKIKLFCETNNLTKPRDNYTDYLTHPSKEKK